MQLHYLNECSTRSAVYSLYERIRPNTSVYDPIRPYTTEYGCINIFQDKPKICTFYAENCIKLAISREKISQNNKIPRIYAKSCVNMHICIYLEYVNEKETTFRPCKRLIPSPISFCPPDSKKRACTSPKTQKIL